MDKELENIKIMTIENVSEMWKKSKDDDFAIKRQLVQPRGAVGDCEWVDKHAHMQMQQNRSPPIQKHVPRDHQIERNGLKMMEWLRGV